MNNQDQIKKIDKRDKLIINQNENRG